MYNRIDMIWAMFKVYLNNPNQIVMQGGCTCRLMW